MSRRSLEMLAGWIETWFRAMIMMMGMIYFRLSVSVCLCERVFVYIPPCPICVNICQRCAKGVELTVTMTSGSFLPRSSNSDVLFSEELFETRPSAWERGKGVIARLGRVMLYHTEDDDDHHYFTATHLLNGNSSLPVDHFPFAQQQSLNR